MKRQQALERALIACPQDAKSLVVAYSGGRDSTALLHALVHAGLPVSLRAVHVCHQLETAAAGWAVHCKEQCEALGVAFSRCNIDVDTRLGGLEAAARDARYAALTECIQPGEILVTAHHAEDQAETFLLQALRGAGVAGLAGMPEFASFGVGRLWRPWLGVPRAEITAYAEALGLDWVEDETNRDPQRARGYLRTRVWPALVDYWPATSRALARSAAWASQAAEAIETLAGVDLAAVRDADNTLRIGSLVDLSAPRRAEVLRRWLIECGRERPDHRHLIEIERLIGAREHAGPCVSFAATQVRRFDARLFAMPRLPAPPPPGTTLQWPVGSGVDLPPGCGRLTMRPACPGARADNLCLVFGRPGARITRSNGRDQPLAEYLRCARVPPWVRERMPRIQAGDTLLALPGLWQHPKIARWFGGSAPVFDWRHNLVRGPARPHGDS